MHSMGVVVIVGRQATGVQSGSKLARTGDGTCESTCALIVVSIQA
jgi:hypothetical protein